MEQSELIVIFLVLSFSLALIVIMKKDTFPEPLRRPLAIISLIMVICSFALMVYSFFLS